MNPEIKDYLDKKAKNLALNKSISTPEAEKRASEFLEVQAMITDWRHMLSEEKIKLLSVQTAVYAEQLSKGTAKTMTENKVTAEASEEYTIAREDLERIENDLSYLRSYYEIFNNGHLFYRQLAKGELN